MRKNYEGYATLSFNLPTAVHCTAFLHSHIRSCSYGIRKACMVCEWSITGQCTTVGQQKDSVDPHFSIHFSSRNPKEGYRTYWGTHACPQSVKYKINCVYLLCTLQIKNQRLNSLYNLVVSPEILTLSMASSAEWLDYRIRKLLDWSSDWFQAISDGMISVERRHTEFNL